MIHQEVRTEWCQLILYGLVRRIDVTSNTSLSPFSITDSEVAKIRLHKHMHNSSSHGLVDSTCSGLMPLKII